MAPRYTYLVNSAAAGGQALRRWRRWEPLLHAHGIAGPTRFPASPEESMDAAVRAAAESDVVVAVGGDGMVFAVLNGLRRAARPEVALGILPLGSGNDAARLAGLASPAEAVRALAQRRCTPFDTIGLTCQDGERRLEFAALVFAGAGLAADILLRTPPALKRALGGRLGYCVGFFLALSRYQPYRMSVRATGFPEDSRLAAVVAANHTHAGGHTMHVGPGADPTDGLLDVSVIRGVSRVAVARQFLRLLRGTHVRHPAVTYRRLAELRIEGDARTPVQADGEVLGHAPATIHVLPTPTQLVANRSTSTGR